MKQKIIIKSLLIAAACGLSLAARANAQDVAPASGATGLLGQTYAGLSYSFTNLSGTKVGIDNYSFEYNKPLSAGFDANFGYNYAQSGVVGGDRAIQQAFGASLRAFSSKSWGTPYVEAGLGYTNVRFAGTKEGSYVWGLAVGAEFRIFPAISATPYVQYSDAPDIGDSEGVWSYGVKANYWVTKRFSIVGDISRDEDKNMDYSIGFNCRF